jgi:hypothetical protein
MEEVECEAGGAASSMGHMEFWNGQTCYAAAGVLLAAMIRCPLSP